MSHIMMGQTSSFFSSTTDGRMSLIVCFPARSYRIKDHTTVTGKEDKNKKTKSKSNDPGCAGGFAEARPSTAEPAI